MSQPTLCLNMIVKNESKVIERLLGSVVNIIDTYCICDTGSTDNTVEIIQQFFEKHNIKGVICHEPFQNFEYNRSYALRQCLGLSDYVLLLDADMILDIRKPFDKSILVKYDMISLFQGNPAFKYHNVRILKNAPHFKYTGVTHEYIDTTVHVPNESRYIIPDDNLFILDVGDGGSKHDKFIRDIRLLTEGIQKDPKNVRYHFYLANSYHDSGQWEKAIEYYQKRISLGGWHQEVWYSLYRIGNIYKDHLNDFPKALESYLNAIEVCHARIENLYAVVKHYRLQRNYKLAYTFYLMASKFIAPKELREREFLFLETAVYDFLLDVEFTIIGYYICVPVIEMAEKICKVLNFCYMEHEITSLFSNMKFYKLCLPSMQTHDFSFSEVIEGIYVRSSSPCIIQDPTSQDGGYLMNIRLVNYRIDDAGRYHDCDEHIVSFNQFVKLNHELEIISSTIITSPIEKGKQYIGVEDVRLYHLHDELRFIGVTAHSGRIGVVEGPYNFMKLEPRNLQPSHEWTCEKNWVYTGVDDLFLYKWNSITIGTLSSEGIFERKKELKTPLIYRHLRGSTNGFVWKDEVWFIAHAVSYESPRHYYHMIIVFDRTFNRILRSSPYFCFEKEPIQYCLGLVIEDDRILCSYSTWDRTSKVVIWDKHQINNMMMEVIYTD